MKLSILALDIKLKDMARISAIYGPWVACNRRVNPIIRAHDHAPTKTERVEIVAPTRVELAAPTLEEITEASPYLATFKEYNREQWEALEQDYLAESASRSIGAGIRLHPEEPALTRTAYYRDLGRIVNCESFRNLAGKTQTFAFPAVPSVHTRLSHSIEVAQLAETIAKALGLNMDLIWAIGLGHDLGHTPFGHAGEEPLEKLGKDFIDKIFRFKHNRQSLRLAMYLEEYIKGHGLNLTLEVLDGILHHCGEIKDTVLVPRREPAYERYLEQLRRGIKPTSLSREEILEILDPNKDTLMPLTWEGLVVLLTDRIAYGPVDLEDALKNGFIVEKDLPDEQRRKLNHVRRILGNSPSEMRDTMINNTIETSKAQRRIAMRRDIGEALNMLIDFNYDNICFHPLKKEFEAKVPFIFNNLFKWFTEVDNKTPQEAIDTIAKMTDQQTIDDFNLHFIPQRYLHDPNNPALH